MAIMSKMRDKTHIVLFILLAAFLALIVFEWGMNYSGPVQKGGLAGKVNGKPISIGQYDEVYQGLSENFRRSNPGADITPQMEMGFREQAWNVVVEQVLLDEQFDRFGVKVSNQEIVEAVDGPNPPMIIRQNFSDPRTGAVDRAKLDKARRAPENKELWVKVEQIVKRELMVNKLLRALQPMVSVTDNEVDELVQRQFARYSASFIPVPISYAGPASAFPVTEPEIKTYYDEHKQLFKQDPTRGADYVFFPLIPSSQDSLQVKKEIETLRAGFVSAPNDSDYVRVQSDRPNAVNVTYNRADFSPVGGDLVFGTSKLAAGQVIGPIADRGQYRLIKVKSVSSGAAAAKASHILIRYNPADRADTERAVALSQSIIKQLQAGQSFAELAAKYSQDPGSAGNGGSVGWFSRGRMVPEFAEAVFSGSPGQILGPVRTQFGLHIIKVEGFDQTQFTCSEITRDIRASTETVESIKRRAMAFQMEAKGKGFEKSAKTEKLDLNKTGEFSKRSLIPLIGFNDKINQFAFKAKNGDISDVIETEQGFFVMRLTSTNDTGYRQLDAALNSQIKSELIREKQGAAVKARLAKLIKASNNTLDGIVQRDTTLSKITSDEIRWSDAYIAGYGYDRLLVESIAGMKLNTVSSPVQTSEGYAVVMVAAKRLPEGLDLESEKMRVRPQLLNAKQEQLFAEYFASIRKNAKIEDFRQ
jgi:parvulin-like peptidyl-prolyl isomerase